MTTATLSRPRRGGPRRKARASGYRCADHGHPMAHDSTCAVCDAPAVEWTAGLDRDYLRVTWAADEAKAGKLHCRFEALPEAYDRERWPDTSPGEMALALSYFTRWGAFVRERFNYTAPRVVRPPAAYVSEDGQWSVDCACGQTITRGYIDPNTTEGAGMALLDHLSALSLAVTHGRSFEDVPGHTRRRDAMAISTEGRSRLVAEAEGIAVKCPLVRGPLAPLEFIQAVLPC